MTFLKNLKIGRKLTIGFAVMILFMMVIGLNGYRSVFLIEEDLVEILETDLAGINNLLQADRDLHQLLVAERSMIFANAKSDVFKSLVADYEENLKQFEDRWEKYRTLAKTGDTELISKFEQAKEEWKALSRKVVDGRIADTRAGRREALDLSLGFAKQKSDEMRKVIDKLSDKKLLLMAKEKKDTQIIYRRTVISLLAVTGIGLVVGIGLSFLLGRGITRPLNKAVDGLKDIAEGEGDLTTRLHVESKDEVGELARWFNVFIERLQTIIKGISDNTDTLHNSSTGLSTISQQMSLGAEGASSKIDLVASATEEMNANMNNIAATMEQASTNVEIVASSAEQMASTIDEIAQNSEKARSITGGAVTLTKSSSDRVEGLGQAAQEISKVTETITDISEQTNLLALNATIEAARAGEAGKGFAVVANEIKDLARQTAEATDEIRNRIQSIQDSISGTITDIEQVPKVINEVNEIVSTIATAVEEQSVTTREIASNVAQVSEGIQEVTKNVAGNSNVTGDITTDISEVNRAAGEMANSSSQINMSAEELAKVADQLKSMVDQFKV